MRMSLKRASSFSSNRRTPASAPCGAAPGSNWLRTAAMETRYKTPSARWKVRTTLLLVGSDSTGTARLRSVCTMASDMGRKAGSSVSSALAKGRPRASSTATCEMPR